jgi:hypothetical protein
LSFIQLKNQTSNIELLLAEPKPPNPKIQNNEPIDEPQGQKVPKITHPNLERTSPIPYEHPREIHIFLHFITLSAFFS